MGTFQWRTVSLTLAPAYSGVGFCCSDAKSSDFLQPPNSSALDFPVLHYLLEFAQTQVHWIGDAIQPFHPLSFPSTVALNPSQYQDLFQSRGKPTNAKRFPEVNRRSAGVRLQSIRREGENSREVHCSLWISSSLLITCIWGWRWRGVGRVGGSGKPC